MRAVHVPEPAAENSRSIALAKALGASLEQELTFRQRPFHMYRHRRHGG
ncbi:MAG: hypothetical protein M0Z99_24330 [Betaproteobacteria bacterium]|nr:hypothetical protein [Betaproteobacteria bacterium]